MPTEIGTHCGCTEVPTDTRWPALKCQESGTERIGETWPVLLAGCHEVDGANMQMTNHLGPERRARWRARVGSVVVTEIVNHDHLGTGVDMLQPQRPLQTTWPLAVSRADEDDHVVATG